MRPEEDINSAEWEGYPFGAIRGCMHVIMFYIAVFLMAWGTRGIATVLGERL